MARPGRELAKVQGAQLAAQRLLGDRDPELLPDPLHQVDQTPAHHPVNGRDRALLDHPLQGRALLAIEQRLGARGLAGPEPFRSRGVEVQHPVAHDLQSDRTDPGRVRARSARVNGRQGQQPTGLVGITRALGQPAQLRGIEVGTERDRGGHGNLPAGDRHRESYRAQADKPP
jgi:hypothetical protein